MSEITLTEIAGKFGLHVNSVSNYKARMLQSGLVVDSNDDVLAFIERAQREGVQPLRLLAKMAGKRGRGDVSITPPKSTSLTAEISAIKKRMAQVIENTADNISDVWEEQTSIAEKMTEITDENKRLYGTVLHLLDRVTAIESTLKYADIDKKIDRIIKLLERDGE